MIDAIKTKEQFNIDISKLQPHNAVKVVWQCDQCSLERVKRYDEAIKGTGLCRTCSQIKQGKRLGNKYGKTQTKTAYHCQGCNIFLTYSVRTKYCEICLSKHMSARMSGSSNPAWTGKNVCECGDKKSTGAKRCRKCSFKSGERSGSNNGRWEVDKGKIVAARTARGILSNVMTLLGKKKNSKTVKILKYTFADFKFYIETQFEPWMNWENKGNKKGCWSVDHIIPVTVLINCGFTDPSVINALWNLRPLCAIKNIQRSNKIDDNARNLAKQKLSLTL